MSEELKLDRYAVTEGGGTFKCPGGEMVYYSDVKSFIADNNAALRSELAALKARQGEAVAYVSEESFSSNGTSDIITCNLPIGTALYTAPPAPADAVSVPRELLKELIDAAEYGTGINNHELMQARALLAQSESKGVKS